MTDVYTRLEWCLHAAFVELDSYLGQLGVLQRVASTQELENLSPDISAQRVFALSSQVPIRYPPPVTVAEDLKVDPHVLCVGAYDKACLRMTKAANNHEYPTLVDNSAIDSFLKNDCSKLASYRKGVRWSLMTSTSLREPNKFFELPDINASDA
eukprot:9295349-Heterocapsa_arctica.AAC.1